MYKVGEGLDPFSATKNSKEFMVQLQTFSTSDYILKTNCFVNN